MSAETVLRNAFSYSVQLAVLVGVGAALARMLRLEPAKWALAYWQALLVAALALPGVQPWRRAVWSPDGGNADVTSLSAAVLRGDDLDWPRLGVALLVAGFLLRLVRFGAGLRSLRRYRLRSRPLPQPAGEAAIGTVSGEIPRLLLSPDVAAPATYGLLRPVVLLPEAFESLPAQQRRDLLVHEALHVRRRHWLLVLVEEVVRAVLWFHPGAVWLVARIRLCREQAVDADVVRLTGSRQAYLETLVAMARAASLGPRVPAPLFLKPSHLKRRVELLLKEVSMSTRRACLAITVGPAALVLTGALAAGAFPLLAPPSSEPAVVEAAATVDREQEPKATGGDRAEVDKSKPKKDTTVEPANGVQDPSRVDVRVVVPRGAASGLSGGVAGGVSGGVRGGVPGGVAGGAATEPGALGGDKAASTTADAADEDEKKASLKPPRIVSKVAPRYPEEAKKEGIAGDVVLRVTIEKSGEVSAVRVVSGESRLAEAAVTAVQQWRYEPPAMAPVVAEVTVVFSLAKSKPGRTGTDKPQP